MRKKFTEVSFFPVKPTQKGLIGFASGLFEGGLSLNSIAVYTTAEGDIRLLFPDRTLPNGRQIHDFYPINEVLYRELKEEIQRKVETVMRRSVAKNEKKEIRK